MKKLRLNYSVCQYIPDAVRQESINIGIAFHCPDTGNEYCKFESIQNKSRVRGFDDEYDSEYFNLMIENLNYHLDYNTIGTSDMYGINVNEFKHINSNDFLNEKLKYYVNEFRFLPVQKIETSKQTFIEDVSDIIKTYLYYDRPRSERITRGEVKKLLKKQIKTLDLSSEFYIPTIKGFENEDIFDLKFKNTLLKTLSFDYSKHKNMISEYKSFMFDLYDNRKVLKDKNILVVVNNDYEKSEFYNTELSSKLETMEELNIEIETLAEFATALISNGVG